MLILETVVVSANISDEDANTVSIVNATYQKIIVMFKKFTKKLKSIST